MVNLIPSTEEKKMNKSIFLSRVYSFVWHIVYSQSPGSCHIRQFLRGKTLCSRSFLCVCGLESICMFVKSFFFLTSTLSFTNLLLCKPKYTSVCTQSYVRTCTPIISDAFAPQTELTNWEQWRLRTSHQERTQSLLKALSLLL